MPPNCVGYPFVSSLNTAAARLTMVAQHLQNSAQLEPVEGTTPQNVVEAGEN